MPRWSICLLFCLFLPACGRSPQPMPQEARGVVSQSMPLAEFAATYHLVLRSAPGSGRFRFDADGNQLVLYTDAPYLSLNGQMYDLPVAPFYRQGTLWVPLSVVERLPEIILARARAPQPAAAASRLIVLDPGHGGHDQGASSNGIIEKDTNLDLAQRVRRYLESAGAPVLMTRQSDVFIPLANRAHEANRRPGAIFVSIHLNQFDDPGVAGTETFVLRNSSRTASRLGLATRSYRFQSKGQTLTPQQALPHARRIEAQAYNEAQGLAQKLQNAVVRVLGAGDRGVKEANFQVLRESYFGPAVLIEIGFLSNPETARRLADPVWRDRIARTIAEVLLAHTMPQTCR